MTGLYFEEIHKAERDQPYIQLQNIDLSYVAHYHNEIELIYVVTGKTNLSVNGTDIVLNEHDIFIIMPGEIHSISGTDNIIYIMKFFAENEFTSMQINGHIASDNPDYFIFKNIIEKIATEYTEQKEGFKYAINMQSNNLLLEIIRTLNPSHISTHLQKEAVKKINFLNKVNLYLENNYPENITIDSFASFMGYSRFYFAHMFKEITGQSCLEFVTFFRLEKSKKMLSDGKPITETAFLCGFNNLRSFNRCFKKYYGITPGSFKKSIVATPQYPHI